MAKKNIAVPVYPEVPLVITRENFCELLTEQIRRGNELLNVEVPKLYSRDSYYGGFASIRQTRDRVEYEEVAEKSFQGDYSRWRDRNKTIYRTAFTDPESIYYHEYESQIWSIWGTDTIKEYKENIRRQINHMQGDIERVDLIRCSFTER